MDVHPIRTWQNELIRPVWTVDTNMTFLLVEVSSVAVDQQGHVIQTIKVATSGLTSFKLSPRVLG